MVDYYVESAAAPGGDGSQATPWSTWSDAMAGMALAADDDTLRVGYGSVFLNDGMEGSVPFRFNIQPYEGSSGLGSNPIVDGRLTVSSWSQADAVGRPNVYEVGGLLTAPADNSRAHYLVTEMDADGTERLLSRASSQADCQSTVGSFYEVGGFGTNDAVVVSVHPSDSGDPASNGKTYRCSNREFAVNSYGGQIRGVEFIGFVGHDGAARFTRDHADNLIEGCTFRLGSQHQCFMGIGTVRANSFIDGELGYDVVMLSDEQSGIDGTYKVVGNSFRREIAPESSSPPAIFHADTYASNQRAAYVGNRIRGYRQEFGFSGRYDFMGSLIALNDIEANNLNNGNMVSVVGSASGSGNRYWIMNRYVTDGTPLFFADMTTTDAAFKFWGNQFIRTSDDGTIVRMTQNMTKAVHVDIRYNTILGPRVGGITLRSLWWSAIVAARIERNVLACTQRAYYDDNGATKNWTADHNIVFDYDQPAGASTTLPRGQTTWAGYQALGTDDQNSIYADPGFDSGVDPRMLPTHQWRETHGHSACLKNMTAEIVAVFEEFGVLDELLGDQTANAAIATAVRAELATELARIDVDVSSAPTVGQIAAQITADHGAGDYTTATGAGLTPAQATQLDEIHARTAQGITVSVGSHVAADAQTLELVQGEAYLDAIGNAITIDIADDRLIADMLSDGTIPTLRVASVATTVSTAGSLVSLADGVMRCRFELTRAQSAGLTASHQASWEIDIAVAGDTDQTITSIVNAPAIVHPQIA